MDTKRFVIGTLLLSVLVVSCEQAKGPVEGAWGVMEYSVSTPDTSYTVSEPQPSQFIFGKQHYSIMWVPGNESRALFADQESRTEAEYVAAYRSFVANSGTYEISDSSLTTHTVVAKNPNRMADGIEEVFTYQLENGNLLLSSTRSNGATTSFKCERLQ